jgi:amino acid adenylation domain-containing protein/non-ribosomal peptide synthase protein (TIGR01720 family)
MKELSDRIAALSPEQRAMFELLRSKQPKKAAAGPPPGPIPRRADTGPAPLSFDQERIWFLHQLDPGETAYNIATITRLRGRLDLPRLMAALNEVVRRHEAWRTVLPAVDGRPAQIVLPHLELSVPVVDDQEVPADRRLKLSPELARDLARQPFDFERGPLVRAVLVRQAEDVHDCILVVHHIVTDWISSQIAWGELAAIYLAFLAGKPSPLPELPVQYADFAVWQRGWMQGEALQRYLDFWVEEIAGAPHALELPTDRPRPPFQTTRGGQAQLQVPADRAEGLRALARQERATSFMAFLALYGALLHRLTGQAKVLISAPNANRNRSEIQPLLGFFLSQILFAVDSAEDPTFRELVQRARATALRSFAHQDLPFGKLVEAVRPERDPSRAPLVQVTLLVLDLGASSASIEMPGLVFEEIVLEEEVAKFDLGLTVLESSGGLGGFVEYNRDLFDRTTAERLARAFEILVDQIGRNPDLRVSELRLLDEAAEHQVLHEWNDTTVLEPALPVHQLVAEQAERMPEAVALVTPDGDITYAELQRRAGALAAWLDRQGIGAEARVGLCVERTAEIAVGMLGIWQAGAAWVPLDPAYPADRLAYILEDAGLAAVVTRPGLAARLGEVGTPLVFLDEHGLSRTAMDGHASAESPRESVPVRASPCPSPLAYVIYTSGTTGRPKGVLVDHANLAHTLRASRRAFAWSAADRIPVLAPFSFDIFLFELWSPLTVGGTAELVPLAPALDLPRLMAGLDRATRLHAVPALMRQIVALARAEGKRWPGVRTIFVGGDAVPPELLADLPQVFPAAEIRILYGPTEGTIICASLRANQIPWEDHGPKTLLGRPLPDAELRLVDRSGGRAAIGVAGELWIGGPGVTRGYLGRAELTAEKYVERDGRRWYRTGDLARWLPDGLLEFLGRVDAQVKVRGFRIEPGEIETALLEHPEIREAVVLAAAVEGGDKRLVAYVVPEVANGAWPETEGAVRAALARRLPEHMVPSAFVPLPELPLTGHGKIDRRALLKLATSSGPAGPADATVPRTPAEEVLAEIWSGLLGVERIGVHDNFFRLGGDSILGIQVVARARKAGLILTPRQIFEHQTIAALAAVAETVGEDAEPDEGPVEGEVPLTPVQLRFFEEEPVDPHWFNQTLLLDVRQPLEPRALDAALQALAAQHDALRWRLGGRGEKGAFIQADATIPFLQVDLEALPEERFSPAVEATAAQLQTAFGLENGPVFLAALFVRAGERRLLLAAHHLVIDAVSWRILLEDLQTAYAGLALPPRTASWKRWAERLGAYASSAAVRKELEHWLSVPAPEALPLDLPGAPEDDTRGAVAAVLVELPAEATTALLREAPVPYRARVDDLLLTALLQAFSRWTGAPRLVLELEGHGREEIGTGRGIDLSRTVGWFTTVFPVALDLGGTHGPGQAIKGVKEQLRAVPGKGLSYGLLRYFGGDRRLAARPEPEVGFNYLGHLDAALPAGGPFAPAVESAGPEQSPRARRRHRIDVDALVWEGRLRVSFTYAARLLDRETMERLAEGFSAALQELIAHCLAPEAGGWTPSDLPLARLTAGEVDALLGDDPTVEDVYPLAPLQSGMLFHTLYTPGSEIYFEQLTATLRGALDVPAFTRAWQLVLDRQPVLRTAFAWEGLRRPLQIVRRGVEIPWTLEDWRDDPEAEARFRSSVAADQERGFDVGRAPLLRLALIRTGEAEHRLLWSFHHLLFDGWCFSILFREVFTAYEAFRRGEAPLLEPVRPYRDYLAWLERQDPAQSEAFWRRRLAGIDAATPVPFDEPDAPAGRAVTDFREVEILLPAPQARALAGVAQEGGLTLNTLVQGAWALLLARWSGRREVVFGAVAAGRPPELPGVESMVGLFINTLPVRAEIEAEEPVLAWLRRLQQEQVEQRAFEWSPLSDVQRWSEVPPGAPLFHSLLVFENYPIDPSIGEHLGELQIGDVRVSERSNYPLTLAVVARDELLLRLGFDARVAPETAERILGQLEAVLAGFAADPGRTLGSLPALAGEKELRERAARCVALAAAPGIHAAEPPRNPVEELLVRVWRSVLRLERIGVHDDFFRLGGDSILSLQIVARARQEGLALTPRQIFENPTIAELAAVALPVAQGAGEERADEHAAPRREPGAGGWTPADFPLARLDQDTLDALLAGGRTVEDIYPVAPLQSGMIFHTLFAPGSEIYFEQLTATLRGPLDPDAFARAWQTVTERHPVLRTAYAWEGLERPLQIVRRGVELPWTLEDWRDEADPGARLRDRAAADRARGFDLTAAPLMRLALLRTGAAEHRLLWSFHHLLFDGWCFSLLFREVFLLYESFRRSEPLAPPELGPVRPYRDYIAWLERQDPARAEAFWRSRLTGVTAATPVPFDHPDAPAGRTAADFRVAGRFLPEPLARSLARLAQDAGLTLNTVVQGAWALLLARWSGRRDVVFGAVVAGRPADLPGIESMIGLFINTLPVRVEVDPEASALPWLRRLQEEQVLQRVFEWSPLADVQRWSGVEPGAPLFQSLVVFENYPVDPSLGDRLGDLEICDMAVSERTNFPLTLGAMVRDRFHFGLSHDRRVAPETAERILSQLEAVLAALAADPGRALGSLPALPDEEVLAALIRPDEPRAAAARAPGTAAPEPPRNPVEESLAGIWRSVLRRDDLGIHDDFFRGGGDSILSLQIVARARQEGLVLTPRQIFENPTIAGQAAVARAVAEEAPPAAAPQTALLVAPAVGERLRGGDPAIEDLYPLAPLQKAMLLHGVLEPESDFYLEQVWCVLHGELDPDAFHGAWQRAVDRHPALRTAFSWEGLEEPLQVVRRGVELPWEVEDWRGLSAAEQSARWDERVAADRRRVFDLGRPPLQRVLLARTADGEHRFLWSFHHLLFDGWCFSLIFRDVFLLYQGLLHGEAPELPEPRPYREFIAWLAARPAEEPAVWWRRRLAGFTAASPLPLDLPTMSSARPDEPGAAEPGERGRSLSAAATAELEAFAQSQRLTLNTLFQGAWALLLARFGAGRDVVAGSVVSGRPPELPGVESMVGLFINTLPLRLDVAPDAPAAAWLQGVQEAQLDLGPYEHVPIADLQGWSELPPGEPLFRSLTVFEKFPYEEALAEQARGLEVRDLVMRDRADVPLSVVAVPTAEGLHLAIAHDHQTEPATADRLLRHLEALMAGLAADPDRPLRDVPLLDDAERSQLLAWGEEGWRVAPDPEADLPVHASFLRRAAERPEAPALLAMEGKVISYGELAQRVGRLAGALREMGVGPEARVGVWLERSPRMIEAVLAVHAAGGAYVPIDPEAPPERVAFLLEDSGAVVLLTEDVLAAALPAVGARVVVAKDFKDLKDVKDLNDAQFSQAEGLSSLGSFESFTSFPSPSSDHLAYVLYTSGSTGTPKGVLVTHRSLAAYVRAVGAIYGLGPSDRAMQFASLSFDASAEEIFTALTTGASLVVRSGPAEDAATFLRRCAGLGLTLLSLPTAYWHLLAAALDAGEAEWPAGIRVVVMGGERALPERWAAWGRGPGFRPRLYNAYGPTEATIGSTFQEHPGVPLPVREVPIGRPLPGWRAHVLDAGLRPLPVGATGELFLGGVGLARGYLGDPARTAERFVPDPLGAVGDRLYHTGDRARWRPDGTLEFAGRIDTQVKVRGFRIELGEVEAALAAQPEVREAAAVTRAEASGNARLLAFVVWRGETGDAARLRAALEKRLPAWMVPSAIVALEALPVTAAGKLDRRALERLAPEAGAAREIRPPSNPVEEGLAEIWRELLGVEGVGLDDDFFALGGHSLLATQLVSRVRQRFGVDLPLHGLFELRTLEDLAREVLARTLGEGEEDGAMDSLLAELDDLSDEEALALLAAEEEGTTEPSRE